MSDEERRTRGAAEIRKIAYLEAELSAIRDAFSTLVERLDDIDKSWRSMSPHDQMLLNIPPEELQRLPWKKYRSGKGEWIFSSDAPTLAEALANEPTKTLIVGGFQYRLQGQDDKFISRMPAAATFTKQTSTATKRVAQETRSDNAASDAYKEERATIGEKEQDWLTRFQS